MDDKEKKKLFISIKIMDKTESIIKHVTTLGATIWAIDIIADKIEQVTYIITTLAIVIIALIIYSVKLKRSNGDKTEQMAKHNQELEKMIDPKRTSSQLTKRGQTNPLDK